MRGWQLAEVVAVPRCCGHVLIVLLMLLELRRVGHLVLHLVLHVTARARSAIVRALAMPPRLVGGHAVVLTQLAAGLPLHGLSQWHAARTLSNLRLHKGRLWHVSHLLLLSMGSAMLLMLCLSRQIDIGHRCRVMQHDLSRRSAWSCHKLPLLLRLVARLPD